VLEAIVFETAGVSTAAAAATVASLTLTQRAELLASYVGERRNRRHRPGRAFEQTAYQFELVTDYGAFRDLQRHRLATIEWQALSPDLGFEVPEVVASAGLAQPYVESLERSAELARDSPTEFPSRASTASHWL